MGRMSQDTIFAKIARREIPAQIVYQDEDVTAFRDVAPAAPVHILVVPNKIIRSLDEAEPGDERLLGKMLLTAQKIAREQGIAKDGYRLVINTNADGGQTVFHLHVHILGGQRLGRMA